MNPNPKNYRSAALKWFIPVAAELLLTAACSAQQYDLLLRGGHVIDPRNRIDAPRDVAVADGQIAAVASAIPPDQARQVIDVRGLHVAPGFIDLHAHVALRPTAILADRSLKAGVTTVVSAGDAGWRTFNELRKIAIEPSKTRVLVFLNISGGGMVADNDLEDMLPAVVADFIGKNRDVVVGIKTAHWRRPTWESVDRAIEAGRLAAGPVMIDFGTFFPTWRPFEELVGQRMRPGDIYTHLYLSAVPMLDQDNRLRPYLREAQQRGVIFDLGHGKGSFAYWQAVPATRDGFWPNTISTDSHTGSVNSGMKDMANVMSKILNLGLPLAEVIARATWAPAQAIRRPELGHLTVGVGADVAVFRLRRGQFGFYDVQGGRMTGDRKIECELTLRDGFVVWDLNGISMRPWEDNPRDAPYK
jgi:dihydroorotase